MSIAANSDSALKRLRWRCRRGTRELDALLGGWLEAQGAQADAETLTAFEALLDQSDPQLWDWLMGTAQPARRDWQEIIDAIRARDRV